MLDGVNVPPTGPFESRLPAVTDITGEPLTVKFTVRDVLPSPVVVLLKVSVAEYDPTAVVFALAVRVRVIVVFAPGANVPLVGVTESHAALLCASFQLSVVLPVFVSV